jgi:hypothetical protein
MSRRKPSLTEANGRDGGGRFAAGNGIAKGNPHAKRVNELRTALMEAVTPRDLRSIVAAMVKAAKGGDVVAAREVLNRTIGTPGQSEILQRIEALEALIE